ncbi:protein-tyrosine phosphatase-like protein [Schizophyllum amplum]|uniref:Protein-tyrosine phosphatase-like protein n=1 Tax=Schizophyllum amplum TaxID=97359 RepID=A0A550C7R3_9AGAR|nr:protein-tyrosine phosphatase-like protein [Auriculariopsis ampla]
MMSFPAQNWQLVYRAATKHVVAADGDARYGRAASAITPRLYLSDYFTARDDETLARLGITHVVSVLELVPVLPERIPLGNRLHVSLLDTSTTDILSHLDRTTEFIRDALAADEKNRVLVHCFQGISRSATVVCAYLLASSTPKAGMLAHETIDWVRERRGIVCPNLGFRRQLDEYAKRYKTVGTPKRLSLSLAGRIRSLRGREKVEAKTTGSEATEADAEERSAKVRGIEVQTTEVVIAATRQGL